MNKLKATATVIKTFVIAAFICVNLGIMACEGLPDQSVLGARFVKLIARYEALSMLYQPWSMFAPNPMNANVYIDAEITFTDGSKESWRFPSQSTMNGWRKILVGDRYRILGQETLLPNRNERVWADVSQYVLRQIAQREEQGQQRTVQAIVFNRHSNYINFSSSTPLRPHGVASTSYDTQAVYYFLPTPEKGRYEADYRH